MGELEQEVLELKVVVANGEAEAVREECERVWQAEREVMKGELQRRKEFEEDLRRELEEARNVRLVGPFSYGTFTDRTTLDPCSDVRSWNCTSSTSSATNPPTSHDPVEAPSAPL